MIHLASIPQGWIQSIQMLLGSQTTKIHNYAKRLFETYNFFSGKVTQLVKINFIFYACSSATDAYFYRNSFRNIVKGKFTLLCCISFRNDRKGKFQIVWGSKISQPFKPHIRFHFLIAITRRIKVTSNSRDLRVIFWFHGSYLEKKQLSSIGAFLRIATKRDASISQLSTW